MQDQIDAVCSQTAYQEAPRYVKETEPQHLSEPSTRYTHSAMKRSKGQYMDDEYDLTMQTGTGHTLTKPEFVEETFGIWDDGAPVFQGLDVSESCK